jgi:hypothetical protein
VTLVKGACDLVEWSIIPRPVLQRRLPNIARLPLFTARALERARSGHCH